MGFIHTHLRNVKAVSRMIAELVATTMRRREAIGQRDSNRYKEYLKSTHAPEEQTVKGCLEVEDGQLVLRVVYW